MQVPREQYGLGSIFKGIKKAVSGVVKGVKKVAKSPIGKAAMLYFAPSLIPGGASTLGGVFNNAGGLSGIMSSLKGTALGEALLPTQGGSALGNFGKVFAGGSALGALAALSTEEQEAATRNVGSLRQYLSSYYNNLGYTADQIAEAVERDTSEYTQDMARGMAANGGRINYAFGDKVEMASGIEGLPININSQGIKELDLRETGGFIPPVGIKEKADDIPAMLSNNEFVYTADAVKAAGGGDIEKGAQVMYDTMKKLESRVA
tara:strand:+ start:468 stop:1256 length:789 start_codon:yes stop_codon:yes gene_type:complete